MPQNDPYRMLNDLQSLIAVLDRRIARAQTGSSAPELLVNLQDLRKRTLELVDQILAGQVSR
jgi:hypothetical protein